MKTGDKIFLTLANVVYLAIILKNGMRRIAPDALCIFNNLHLDWKM